MIDNVGIDIVENKRIKLKKEFIIKVLSENEIKTFNNKNKKQQKEFLAGRWAVKEAIIKTLTHPISMNKIDIEYVDQKPVIQNQELNNILISISHEKKYAVGIAIKQCNIKENKN
ncbi:holo-ACP synthase [Mycoplasma feriruminatoris]|uniref:Holo-[acyl-carrier-protein] synthase n=1 Tax=Mycoplasma feriruminatoris TaxID=1179777 RepID=A0AAX3TF83_9MOLU|nr:4'-phosphopantetheinyl transferase superfamily protein [Mycoplasma feriruminatoris]UKS54037.1 phosphopantetheine--transferase domain protein [Mycoplasma feriruminatoris]WFQ92568.1 Holo-[acyl-carrier-protein] synthase [Mycoplasma feriruminatoris]WFQ93435.1 holo-ACP synthase [Mycoplasma feriruminatoris]VZK65204.1 Holo-[acyl-carrier-protein] synthase [Mycoplasma feriruminatoris]VZR75350.1 Holo-[acyl-carrier-protein] synthase [Mycoplasma feriruminatoris]